MKFLRKLIVRDGQYGSISVPKPVLDAWVSVEIVKMLFDETQNTLVIVPQKEGVSHEPI
jgi:hypothetical protein